jgi:hypothetical protein
MIQIRQPKHSATVIRLDSLFAHGDGLPCRRIQLRQTAGAMQALVPATDLKGFERQGLETIQTPLPASLFRSGLLPARPLPIAAMIAVAVTGPMPGIATSRRQASFSLTTDQRSE